MAGKIDTKLIPGPPCGLSRQQIERAAREACRLRGQDPDSSYLGFYGERGGKISHPAWKMEAEMIRKLAPIIEAVLMVREQSQEPKS